MNNNYEVGVCEGCSNERLIVYKTGNLCAICNNLRLAERYRERAKKKPPKKIKWLKRSPIKKNTAKTRKKIKEDEKVYELLWNSKPHYCEECGKFLGDDFRSESGFVIDKFRYSHILTKGSHPEHRHNLTNFNILCLEHHQQWEVGDRSKMKIFENNVKIMERLKNGKQF